MVILHNVQYSTVEAERRLWTTGSIVDTNRTECVHFEACCCIMLVARTFVIHTSTLSMST